VTKVKVNLPAMQTGTVIEIDGTRVEGSVERLTLEGSAETRPRLLLSLIVNEIEVDGEMQVLIPGSTHQALVALGWTPPAGRKEG
jgi:hypothetical protein